MDAANHAHWTRILEMSDEEVLHTYSSTPQWEVPWFVATLQESARLVKRWNEPRPSS
ncbi:hypothetical protein [Halomonas sp. M4R1S46]|uniref:hypothetical protein n=1 Tax=Halomonas sp. M4R1S46 TaxID=2982692 RepID=UPI0021E382AE|nr:hypothetical protein [Halomonas sp. M4R1S46]UYG09096.1 hypothetical protein OCT48_07150 [Halomonas sp. M4R1S46]